MNLCQTSFAEYYPLTCEGKVPRTFQTNYFEKSAWYFEEHEKSGKNGSPYLAKEYYHSNQYFLKGLILSGDLIFGDPISQALQTQADRISQKFEFTTKPLVFLLRSTEANAFTTQTGAIIFTTGLVSHLDNFYELIYILCHEMIHLQKDHMYKQFLEGKDIFRNGRDPSRIDSVITTFYLHSQVDEYAADQDGFRYYQTMKYPQEMAVKALMRIDSAHILPFFSYNFDSTLSLNSVFPGLSVNKKELTPYKKLQFEYQSKTHPDMVNRIDAISEQKRAAYTPTEIEDADEFSNFKKIAINETLYAYFLDNQYFFIIAYYYLGDHSYCDKQFLNYLYAKSLYSILKIQLALIRERSEYSLNTIVVEYPGPLSPWIEMLEPDQILGPERPFIKYFKDMPISELWKRTSEAVLDCSRESEYFYNPLIFKDCVNAYSNLQLDTLESESLINLRDELQMTAENVGIEYDKLTISSYNILLDQYKTKLVADTYDHSKINYEYFENLIAELLDEMQPEHGDTYYLQSPKHLTTSENLNTYLVTKRCIKERGQLSVLKSYDTSPPNSDYLSCKTVRYIRIAQKRRALFLYSFDLSLEDGTYENEAYIEMRTSNDSKRKISSLLKKYFKAQPDLE